MHISRDTPYKAGGSAPSSSMLRAVSALAMEKEQLRYCDKLCPTAQCRYKEKLIDIKGVDPSEITTKQWSTNFDLLPPISHGDILARRAWP